MAGWAHHQISRPASAQHMRSQSTVAKSTAQATPNRVSRAISASALSNMAQVQKAPGLPGHSPLSKSNYNDDDEYLSTLPDPRSRAMSPANSDGAPSAGHHPDLHNEVATLSNKLINAINHQTNLDDTLSATRHELETSRERIRQLELEQEEHANQIARGILIRSSIVRDERIQMATTVAEERRLREEADKGRKKMELELETLTADLFEEANKMVIVARESAKADHDSVTKKNEQLKAQLTDTELLLKSHQEQLAELKLVMEHMSSDRDDATNATAPSTPGFMSKFDSKDDARDSIPASASSHPDVTPSYPTSFTHLIQPVLRTDLSCYDDFSSLLKISKMYQPAGSRVSSGSYGGIGIGLGLGGYIGPSASSVQAALSSVSNTSASAASSPATPVTPASTTSSSSTPNANTLPLKETRFYKRTLAEDIEPCLRLDTAPGLSWLARRSVLNSMCDGTLVVEPMPQTSTSKLYQFPCSLCGENRKDTSHARTHRFRTSESDTAQRYPLCKYCLGRIRSCCDFLGFLRVLKDGHWRTDDEEAEKAAWEESVRLREQIFWARVGGGVIPTVHHLHNAIAVEKSPRTTLDSEREKEMMESIAELERTGQFRPRDVTPIDAKTVAEVIISSPLRKRTRVRQAEESVDASAVAESEIEAKEEEPEMEKLENSPIMEQSDGDNKHLNLTIPGSFSS